MTSSRMSAVSEPHVLRLWLGGPLQSWGTASRFEVRSTELAPSKSGVIGLLCAALGRSRDRPVDDLAALRFGVCIERPGSVLRDYHTVGTGTGRLTAASGNKREGIVTERYYLEDAAFVVGLEGEDEGFARELLAAVRAPRWLLGLGRRSCPPAGPMVDDQAIFAGCLKDALAEGWRPAGIPPGYGFEPSVELLIEDEQGSVVLNDQPAATAFADRTFPPRRVRSMTIQRPAA
jgi:CRISPR system Cascade subunit CasD